VAFLIDSPILEVIKELELILPLKQSFETNDIVIFLEETKIKHVTAKFAQIVRISPAPAHLENWQTISFCILEMPLIFRSIIMNANQMAGRELFTIHSHKHFIRPINMELLAAEHPCWQFPAQSLELEAAQERLQPLPPSAPPKEKKPPKPKLTLVKIEPDL
jgi:hypothetical protein